MIELYADLYSKMYLKKEQLFGEKNDHRLSKKDYIQLFIALRSFCRTLKVDYESEKISYETFNDSVAKIGSTARQILKDMEHDNIELTSKEAELLFSMPVIEPIFEFMTKVSKKRDTRQIKNECQKTI